MKRRAPPPSWSAPAAGSPPAGWYIFEPTRSHDDSQATVIPMVATSLQVKVASEDWELEQVYALNYRTFVEEIPQHSPNEERRLVDRLLARSVCYVGLEGRR